MFIDLHRSDLKQVLNVNFDKEFITDVTEPGKRESFLCCSSLGESKHLIDSKRLRP